MSCPSDYDDEDKSEEEFGCLIAVLGVVVIYALIAIVLAMS
jgi:hypothetical protein